MHTEKSRVQYAQFWPKNARLRKGCVLYASNKFFKKLLKSSQLRYVTQASLPFTHFQACKLSFPSAGTLRCLQKEMATYRHWFVSLWRDPDDVPHCRILSPDKTEWRLISATVCGWRRCFVADQLWLMTRIWEEEDSLSNETVLMAVPLFTVLLNNYTFFFKNLIMGSRLKIVILLYDTSTTFNVAVQYL